MPDDSIWDENVPVGEQIDETIRRREESGAAGENPPPLAPLGEAPLPQAGVPAPVKTVEEAEVAFAHVLDKAAVTLEKVAAKDRRKRGRTQKAPTGDGRCRAYAPYGTKCKLCGKVHPV